MQVNFGEDSGVVMLPNRIKKISKYTALPILLLCLLFLSGCPGDGIFNEFSFYNDNFIAKFIVWIAGWLGGSLAMLIMGAANDSKRIDHYNSSGQYMGHSNEEIPDSGDVNFGFAMAKFWLVGYPAFYLIWWIKSLIGME